MNDLIIELTSRLVENLDDGHIIIMMKQAIETYEKTGDFGEIYAVCAMITQRDMIRRHGSVENTIKAFNEFKSVKKAFDHTQNKS